MTDLIVVENIKPMVIFSEKEEMDKVIGDIKKTVSEFKPDMSTVKGRKEIASLAYKVAQSKTFLDNSGKELTAQAREKIDLINAERNRVVGELQDIQDSVRKPLTDWENAEKDRVAGHEDQLGRMSFLTSDAISLDIKELKNCLSSLDSLYDRDWQEFKDRAANDYEVVKNKLTEFLNKAVKAEEERQELERLRKEAAEREEKDREERIAREAAETAKREAEEKAAREAAEAEAKAQAEREEIERKAKQEREAAEAAKLEAERKAKAEQEESERLKRDAEERAIAAEKAKKEAEEEAARQVAEAAENERKRLAAEKKAEEDAAKKREEDNKHKVKYQQRCIESTC